MAEASKPPSASAAGRPETPSVTFTLPSDREIRMTRVFDAPRHLVFDALTRPELVKRWYGPPPEKGWAVVICEADLRTGGAWRIVMRRNSGAEIALHGVYREFLNPERYVATQLMSGCEGQGESEALVTMTLVEAEGRTTFTNTVQYQSREVRDAVLKSGATEQSMSAIYDKLAVLLASGAQNP